MTGLVRYEAARRALAEAVMVDEVKEIIDKTAAMEEYARRAKDGQLIGLATELRLRAERRLGQLIEEDGKVGKLNRGGGDHRVSQKPGAKKSAPSLASRGVDKNLANRARKRRRLPEDQFEAEVEEMAKLAAAVVGGDKEVIKAARAKRNEDKREKRAAREQELATKIAALPQKRFGVILADPERRFEPYSRETGMDRAADSHYPTSVLEVIAARPVETIAATDAVVLLWATVPMMPQAVLVMGGAWGCDYVSHIVWNKPKIGTGFWVRNKHELLLIGSRGEIPAPAFGTQFDSVIDADLRAHSEKPEFAYLFAETFYPHLPKIELNARKARPGWDRWGNEAPSRDDEIETASGGDEVEAPTPEDDFPDIPLALRRTA